MKMDSRIVLNKLNNYFGNNIQLVFVDKTVIIVTKDDIVYQFNNNLETFLVFSNNQNIESYVESQIFKQLCYKRVVDLKGNKECVVARTKNGQLSSWMRFNGSTDESSLTQYLSDKQICDICCGGSHSLAFTNCGEVYAWGQNSDGQVGNQCNDNQLIPIKLNAFNDEKVISI
jgi:alpha-tubulin suppressor-like RCC1 family protein